MGEHKRKRNADHFGPLPPVCAPYSVAAELTCLLPKGHEGPHHWEYCPAEYECYVTCSHSCDLLQGHEGPHRATIEWGSQ